VGVRGNRIRALNLYAKQPAAFAEKEEQVGMMFAAQAPVALACLRYGSAVAARGALVIARPIGVLVLR